MSNDINNIMDQKYKDLLSTILKEGERRPDRTGTGIISLFGPSIFIDVSERIPLLTTKKINPKNIIHETIWMFVKGDTNIRYLKDNNVNIWNQWCNEDGELGPIYGRQARGFQGWRWLQDEKPEYPTDGYDVLDTIDQIDEVIKQIKADPYSRRHVITLWNPSTAPIPGMSFADNIKNGCSALPVCHGALIQFYVDLQGRLSLIQHQRK
jgi:thymidylate synthase